jgi:hypothetical protein
MHQPRMPDPALARASSVCASPRHRGAAAAPQGPVLKAPMDESGRSSNGGTAISPVRRRRARATRRSGGRDRAHFLPRAHAELPLDAPGRRALPGAGCDHDAGQQKDMRAALSRSRRLRLA